MRQALIIMSFLPATLFASHYRGLSVSTDDRDITDCSQLRVTIDDEPAARAEETVPVGDLRSLVVRAPQNGGIHVTGSDSGRFEVTACKAAGLDSSVSDTSRAITSPRSSNGE